MFLDPATISVMIKYGAMAIPTAGALFLASHVQRPIYRPSLQAAMNFGEFIVKKNSAGEVRSVYHRSPKGSMMRIFRIRGCDYSETGHIERKAIRSTRKRFLEACGENNVKVKFITKRRDLDDAAANRASVSPLVDEIERRFNAQFSDLSIKKYYVCLEVDKDNRDSRDKLDKAVTSLKSTFKTYGLEELSHDPDQSEHAEFYADLINPGTNQRVRGKEGNFYKAVASTSYGFTEQTGVIRFWRNTRESYGAFVVINEWEGHGDDRIIDAIVSLPYEITVNHICLPLDKKTSRSRAKTAEMLDLERLGSADAIASHKKYQRHFETNANDPRCMVFQQLFIFVHSQTKEELEAATDAIVSKLNVAFEIKSSTLSGCTREAYLNFFPGNYMAIRQERVDSKQVATLTPFEGAHSGFTKSRWGSHIQIYPAARGTGKVHVTFHENQRSLAANWAILGKTGAGKTVLASHLILSTLAAHENIMILFVTRRMGGYPAVKAAGGKFLSLNHEDPNALKLNPFDGKLTPEKKKRITRWLRLVGGRSAFNDSTHDDAAEQAIEHVLRTLSRAQDPADMELRRLDTMYPTHLQGLGEFSQRIRPFAEGESYQHLFNGERDDLASQLNGNARFFALDSHGLVEDDIASAPVFFHVLTTLEAAAAEQGRPWMVVFDEAPALLRNRFVKELIKELAVEIRKTFGAIGMLFQQPAQVKEAGLVEMLNTQFMTKFYFKSVKTDPNVLRDDFNLPERAVQMITGSDTDDYDVVMQKDAFTTAFNVNLRCLGDHIELLNSDQDASQALLRLEKIHGDQAMQKYLELKGKYEGIAYA
ncbi:VirB4 family type IV secretion system protein (plasmid) [Thalassospira sp. SM2505]